MFCSNSPDLIISNVCSIINSAEKCRNTVNLSSRGCQKLDQSFYFSILAIASSSTHQLKNPSPQNSNKIKRNPKFHSPNPISYPISSKLTKIKHSSHFPIQKIKIIFIQIQHQKSIISLIYKHFFDIHFYQTAKTTSLII